MTDFVDDTVDWLLSQYVRTQKDECMANNLELAIDYAAAATENAEDRQHPWHKTIISLDENDYRKVYEKYPESKRATFVSCDLQHLYERIKASSIKFGKTKLLILNLKYNPVFDLETKDFDIIEQIAKLFCGEDWEVTWGLLQTNSVVRIGVELIYQE